MFGTRWPLATLKRHRQQLCPLPAVSTWFEFLQKGACRLSTFPMKGVKRIKAEKRHVRPITSFLLVGGPWSLLWDGRIPDSSKRRAEVPECFDCLLSQQPVCQTAGGSKTICQGIRTICSYDLLGLCSATLLSISGKNISTWTMFCYSLSNS